MSKNEKQERSQFMMGLMETGWWWRNWESKNIDESMGNNGKSNRLLFSLNCIYDCLFVIRATGETEKQGRRGGTGAADVTPGKEMSEALQSTGLLWSPVSNP